MTSLMTKVELDKKEEDLLGYLVTDWEIFNDKIRQGRGSMVCIYFELKEVQGGDSPTDTMDIGGYHLFNNGVRAAPDHARVNFRIHGPGTVEFRAQLIEHSKSLQQDDPIRCLFSGYGAKISRRTTRTLRWAADELICKIVRPPPVPGRYQTPDDRLWFKRMSEMNYSQTQRTQPGPSSASTDQSGTAAEGAQGSSNAQISTQELSTDATGADHPAMPPPATPPPASEPLAEAANVASSSQPLNGERRLEGISIKLEPTDSPSSRSDHRRNVPGTHGPNGSDDAERSIQPLREQGVPVSSQESWFGTPGQSSSSASNGRLPATAAERDLGIGSSRLVDRQTTPPASAASSSRKRPGSPEELVSGRPSTLARIEDEGRTAATVERSTVCNHTPAGDGIETQALLAEAEAQGLGAPDGPQGSEANTASDQAYLHHLAAALSPTSTSRPITQIMSTKFNHAHNFLAVLMSAAEPRPTITGSANFSQHIAIADSTGWLKIMLFASDPRHLLPDVTPGTILFLQNIQIKHWAGSTEDGKQGAGNEGLWSWAGLPPKDGPNASSVVGTLYPKLREKELREMLAMSDWYHRRGGKAELTARFPKAKLRPLKRLCDIGGENEFFDMIGEVLAVYPPESGSSADAPVNKPADVFVTDYTSHPETRAAFDQHLGYEESEYEARFADGPGGGMVFRIALWGRQIVAVHGLHVGQYVHIQNIKSKWNADYGISGAVGSRDDLNLKVKDASEHPYLPQLIERKNAWVAEREAVLAHRRAEEEENEIAWREAHDEVPTHRPAPQMQRLTGSPARQEQQPNEEEANLPAPGDAEEQRPNEETQPRLEDRAADHQVDGREPVPVPRSQEQEAPSEDELMSEREEESQAQAPPEEAEPEAETEPETEAQPQAEAQAEAETEAEAEAIGELEHAEEAQAEAAQAEEVQMPERTADATTSTIAEPAAEEQAAADPSSAESEQRSGTTSHHSSWPEAGQRTSAPVSAPLTTPPLPLEQHTHHLQLAPFAHAHPLVSFQELQDLTPDPSKPGREGATYARVRAEVIDVMPRRPAEWVRSAPHAGEKRLTFALLLREQAKEGEQEQDATEGQTESRRCLPLIVADGAARIFLGLEGVQDALSEDALVARAKRAAEGLLGWGLSDTNVSDTNGSGSGEVIGKERQTRAHEWGVAVWVGRKGRKMHSVWGCEVVD